MEDGDVSLILKNVMINDTGTYKCLVYMEEICSWKYIGYIRLSVPPDPKSITAVPGQDVSLTCQAPNNIIIFVKWSRADLEDEYVLMYRDGHIDPANQHPSFKNRVDLQDRQMKDGNVSLILKGVTIHNAGTYECRVFMGGTRSWEISIINLTVVHTSYQEFITVVPGQDVTLTCRAPDSNIIFVKWIRTDLEDEYVLMYQDGHFDPDNQHPSFKNRVDLQDRRMKDGDVSLILKDVTFSDAGTYMCRVQREGDSLKFISINNLRVVPPDQEIITKSGQDVTLTCRAPNNNISSVLWIRAGLETEYLLSYWNDYFYPDIKSQSFINRVDLQDRQMKDGDVSLIVKDVTIKDTGIYMCSVSMVETDVEESGWHICRIHLHVVPPGQTGRLSVDGSVGLLIGLSVSAVFLVAVVVVVFLIYRTYERQNRDFN